MVARSYTHTSTQCSPTSVGFAKARSNNKTGYSYTLEGGTSLGGFLQQFTSGRMHTVHSLCRGGAEFCLEKAETAEARADRGVACMPE